MIVLNSDGCTNLPSFFYHSILTMVLALMSCTTYETSSFDKYSCSKRKHRRIFRAPIRSCPYARNIRRKAPPGTFFLNWLQQCMRRPAFSARLFFVKSCPSPVNVLCFFVVCDIRVRSLKSVSCRLATLRVSYHDKDWRLL